MFTQGFLKKAIIAEIGSVHDGSYGNACKLIEAAAECGADAVKFQTHIAEAESLRNAPSPGYFSAESRVDYFRRTGFSALQWKNLAEHARAHNVHFLSSPFSLEAVALLEEAGVGVYKIPSGEVTNLPLLERVVQTGKPVLLSSGMSDWAELDAAVEVLRRGGPFCVMQCTSMYPCSPEKVGLNVIQEMQSRYGVPVGFSDHTLGFAASFAAASYGAAVIEKHFTFSRLMYGSDAKHSMEPPDFKRFCEGLREIWTMIEHPVDKADAQPFSDMKRIFEKSIVAARPLHRGTVLELSDLAFKKPGTGINAARYRSVLGKRLNKSVPADHVLGEKDFA